MKLEEVFARSKGFVKDSRVSADMKDALAGALAYSPATLRAMIVGNKPWIYRGFKSMEGSHVVMDSSTMRGRQSKNADNNAYTLLIDNLPAWHDYPKRSQSYICSTSLGKAVGYGNDVYVLIPHDDVKIGWCPERDVWFSFNVIRQVFKEDDMNGFNLELEQAVSMALDLSPKKSSLPNASWPAFKAKIDAVTTALKGVPYTDLKEFVNDRDRLYRYQWSDNSVACDILFYCTMNFEGDLMSLLEYYLDPAENGFQVSSYPDAEIHEGLDGCECWFSGKAIAVQHRHIEEFLDAADKELRR